MMMMVMMMMMMMMMRELSSPQLTPGHAVDWESSPPPSSHLSWPRHREFIGAHKID
jgi:hypothetical protein